MLPLHFNLTSELRNSLNIKNPALRDSYYTSIVIFYLQKVQLPIINARVRYFYKASDIILFIINISLFSKFTCKLTIYFNIITQDISKLIE